MKRNAIRSGNGSLSWLNHRRSRWEQDETEGARRCMVLVRHGLQDRRRQEGRYAIRRQRNVIQTNFIDEAFVGESSTDRRSLSHHEITRAVGRLCCTACDQRAVQIKTARSGNTILHRCNMRPYALSSCRPDEIAVGSAKDPSVGCVDTNTVLISLICRFCYDRLLCAVQVGWVRPSRESEALIRGELHGRRIDHGDIRNDLRAMKGKRTIY